MMSSVDVSYAVPHAHGIVNVTLYWGVFSRYHISIFPRDE
jgi:hypothetical protein